MFFQIIGVVLLLAFYTCYFGKMLCQKKQGIQTNQMGKGKRGMAKGIELSLKCCTCLVAFAEMIALFLNVSGLPTWCRVTGVLLGIAGVAIFILSVVTMKDSWRVGVPEGEKTELVTVGIYGWSRNPAFLGFDLLYLGLLLMFFHWALFLVTVLAVLMLHLQIINVEEDFLVQTFGEEYLNYRKKVCRYLGRKD